MIYKVGLFPTFVKNRRLSYLLLKLEKYVRDSWFDFKNKQTLNLDQACDLYNYNQRKLYNVNDNDSFYVCLQRSELILDAIITLWLGTVCDSFISLQLRTDSSCASLLNDSAEKRISSFNFLDKNPTDEKTTPEQLYVCVCTCRSTNWDLEQSGIDSQK